MRLIIRHLSSHLSNYEDVILENPSFIPRTGDTVRMRNNTSTGFVDEVHYDVEGDEITVYLKG